MAESGTPAVIRIKKTTKLSENCCIKCSAGEGGTCNLQGEGHVTDGVSKRTIQLLFSDFSGEGQNMRNAHINKSKSPALKVKVQKYCRQIILEASKVKVFPAHF